MKSLARVWFDAHEDFYSWYYTQETMENNKEWDKPPNILEDTSIINGSPNKHVKRIFISANIKPRYMMFEANYFTVYYWITFPPVHVQQVPLSHFILYI